MPTRRATTAPELPVAVSDAMRRVIELANRVAVRGARVLLTGETGTGKEVIAELIHRVSGVAGPFVRVNCAAMPEALLESELFGHERGAFTGADRQRIGRFEQAAGGTLLLDEIGELSTSTQVKLLRALEEGEFQRLGGVETIQCDARILAATNKNLVEAIRDGAFRQDLFYRLNVVGIRLSPLRERIADVPLLAERFVESFCRELGLERKVLTPGVIEVLCSQSWPGNVRQLRNTIERAVITGPARIEARNLSLESSRPVSCGDEGLAISSAPGEHPRDLSLAHAEREAVLRALECAGFVQKEAAGLLGVSARKLNYMIGRLGVTHPSWRRNRGPRVGVEEPEPAAFLERAVETAAGTATRTAP